MDLTGSVLPIVGRRHVFETSEVAFGGLPSLTTKEIALTQKTGPNSPQIIDINEYDYDHDQAASDNDFASILMSLLFPFFLCASFGKRAVVALLGLVSLGERGNVDVDTTSDCYRIVERELHSAAAILETQDSALTGINFKKILQALASRMERKAQINPWFQTIYTSAAATIRSIASNVDGTSIKGTQFSAVLRVVATCYSNSANVLSQNELRTLLATSGIASSHMDQVIGFVQDQDPQIGPFGETASAWNAMAAEYDYPVKSEVVDMGRIFNLIAQAEGTEQFLIVAGEQFEVLSKKAFDMVTKIREDSSTDYPQNKALAPHMRTVGQCLVQTGLHYGLEDLTQLGQTFKVQAGSVQEQPRQTRDEIVSLWMEFLTRAHRAGVTFKSETFVAQWSASSSQTQRELATAIAGSTPQSGVTPQDEG